MDQISRGTIASMDAIALREGCSKRQVERTIASAFLSPEIVKAAAEGYQMLYSRSPIRSEAKRELGTRAQA
ncbi:MAG: hypothetical protein JWM36_1014 [Hyphomicrobiales bacterium]|nr:hypothetical protein [Hyphomicrobiales bacterium]